MCLFVININLVLLLSYYTSVCELSMRISTNNLVAPIFVLKSTRTQNDNMDDV